MKKVLTALLSFAMVAGLASCQKSNNDTPVIGNVALTLGMTDADTKVTYTETGEGNLHPAWEVGDVIVGQTSAGSASFALKVTSVSGGTAFVKGNAPLDVDVCLLYKKGLNAISSLPVTVDYSNQSGDKGMPAVMLSSGRIDKDGKGTFTFKSAGAVIGIDNAKGVPAGSTISKVKISGDNLCKGSVDKSGNAFVLTPVSHTGDVISTGILSGITVGSGDDRKLSRPVLIAVPVGARVAEVTLIAGYDSYSYTLANAKQAAANSYFFVKTQSFTKDNPDGSIPGKFSVSATKKVWFSKGNLQYVKSGTKWQFASTQYETVETDGQNVGTNYADAPVQSLFGWGDNVPLRTPKVEKDYVWPAVGDPWGSKIDNKGTWRTLSQEEWAYLIANHQYKWATVAGKGGLIVSPDDYQGTISDAYTAAEWASAEAEGLVFLPAAGSRSEGIVELYVGEVAYGSYWSSTPVMGNNYSNSLTFGYVPGTGTNVDAVDYDSRYFGLAVRLVSDFN